MATQARARKHADDDTRSGPRPMWKGAVTFGLVTMPVALHPPPSARTSCRSACCTPRREPDRLQARVPRGRVEVPWAEIVKGYALAKDRYVVVTDEDFEKARVPAPRLSRSATSCRAPRSTTSTSPQPYYVAPAGPAAAKPYALLRDALAQSGRVGVGTIVLRQREHLAALEPAGQALVLTTLRWAYELRSPSSLGLPSPTTARDRRELALALRLIETLAVDWDPKRYKGHLPRGPPGHHRAQGGGQSRSARPGSSVSRRCAAS